MADPFDLRTSKMNKKGQVVSETPYILFVEGGVRKYERPPGSGEFFYENGDKVLDADRPASAPQPKKEESAKTLKAQRAQVQELNKKAKDHAEDKANKDTPEELTDSEQEALNSLLKED